MLAESLLGFGVIVPCGKFTDKIIHASREFLSALALISQDIEQIFGRRQEILGRHRCQSAFNPVSYIAVTHYRGDAIISQVTSSKSLLSGLPDCAGSLASR